MEEGGEAVEQPRDEKRSEAGQAEEKMTHWTNILNHDVIRYELRIMNVLQVFNLHYCLGI